MAQASQPAPGSTPSGTFSARRNIRLLTASTIIAESMLFLPIWIVYLTDLRGLSLGEVGVMETFFWAVAIVAEVPTGAFSDRFGRRATFIVADAMGAAGILLFALAGNLPLLILSYVLWSGGIAFNSGNMDAYVFETLAAEGRQDDFPKMIGRITAFGAFATMAGSLIGALMAGLISLQAPIFAGAAMFVVAIPIVALLQEPPQRRSAIPLGYMQTMREGGRALRRTPHVALLILATTMFILAATAGMMLNQPFLQHYDVPIAAFGLFFAPLQLLAALGVLLVYRLPQLIGMRRSLTLLFFLPPLVLVIMGSIDHLGAFAGFAIARTAMNSRAPLINDYINRRTNSEVRATVLSVRHLGVSIMFAVGAPIAGLLGERSLQGALTTIGLATLLLGGVVYVLWLRADRRAPEPGG